MRGSELTRRIIQQLNRLSNELWVANQIGKNGLRERDKVESCTSYVMLFFFLGSFGKVGPKTLNLP